MSDDLHFDILPDKQRDVLGKIGPVVDEDQFYLAGGTGVALHLGHRQSVDLDWFTRRDFGDPLQYAEVLQDHGLAIDVRETAKGTLHARLKDVLLSFLYYSYELIDDLSEIQESQCKLASLSDLACMKLSALSQRGAKKDFIDIWAIGKHGVSLPELFEMYREKFGVENIGHLLSALCYFDDAESDPMPQMYWDIDWEEIKANLRARVKNFTQS